VIVLVGRPEKRLACKKAAAVFPAFTYSRKEDWLNKLSTTSSSSLVKLIIAFTVSFYGKTQEFNV